MAPETNWILEMSESKKCRDCENGYYWTKLQNKILKGLKFLLKCKTCKGTGSVPDEKN